MECMKCQGLMVEERANDELTRLNEWRCLNCGSILDPLIVQHRNQSQRKTRSVEAA